MDPVGPWSAYAAASYNRLTNATGVTGANDYHRQLAAVGVAPGVSHMSSSGGTATTSHQLLLQAAHASAASAVSTPSAFNPGRFLSPPPVGYDAVFSPLFHQKNTYNATLNQHHPTLKQPASEPNVVGAAADIVSQYGAMHHQTLAAAANVLFDHQSVTSPSTSSPSSTSTSSASASPYQPSVAHTQLHSPFGILPHESVLNSDGSVLKANGSAASFDNPFNTHFCNAQPINNTHNTITTTSSEFSQDNTGKKVHKSQNSPLNKSPSVSSQSVVKSVIGSSLYANNLHVQQQAVHPSVSSAKFSCKCGLNCVNLQCCLNQQQRIGGNVPATVSSTSPNNNNSVIINNYQNINKSCSSLNNVIVNKNNNDNNHSIKKTQVNATMPVDRRQASSETAQKEQCSSGQSSPVCFAMTTIPSVHRAITDYSGNSSNSNSNTISNNNSSSVLGKGSPRNIISNSQYHSPHRSAVSPVSYCQNMASGKTPPIDLLKSTGVSGMQKSPDCGVVVPRRPSPLQAHSQSSPLAHVPSPAYPMYNSPVTSLNSPTQQASQTSMQPQRQPQNYNNLKQTTSVGGEGNLSPLDVSVQRRSICEPINKNFLGSTDCSVRQQNSNPATRSWEVLPSERDRINNNSSQKSNTIINSPSYETVAGPQRHIEQQQQQQMYYSCRVVDRSVSVVKQNNCDDKSSPEPSSSAPVTPPMVRHKRNYDKNNVSNKDLTTLNVPSSSPSSHSPPSVVNRVPPPAHNNQQQNENYFDYERWNPPGSVKLSGVNSLSESFIENNKHIMSGIYNSNHFMNSVTHQTNQSLNLPSTTYHSRLSSPLSLSNSFYHNPHPHHSSGLHVSLMNPYSHSNSVSPSHDLQNTSVVLPAAAAAAATTTTTTTTTVPAPASASASDSAPGFETSSEGNAECKTVAERQLKVIVPNIEEELDFLLDDKLGTTVPVQKHTMAAMPEKTMASTTNSSNGGFMASYIKFLQGERDTSPPSLGRNTRRAPITRVKPLPTVSTSVTSSTTSTVSSTASSTTSSSQSQQPNPPPPYDPEDDPRYFPLPKTSAHRRSLDSSDDDDNNGEFSYFKNMSKKIEPVSKTDPTQVLSVTNKPLTNMKPDAEKSKSIKNSTKNPVSKTENKVKVVKKEKNSAKSSNKKKEKIPRAKRKSETVNNEVTTKTKKSRQPRKKKLRSVNSVSDNSKDDNEDKIENIEGSENNEIVESVPQRTVPKRKAKENLSTKGLIDDDDDDFEDLDNDEADEDFEPDWTPMDDEDYLDHGRGRKRKGRLSIRNSASRRSSRTRNSSSGINQNRRSKRSKSELTVKYDYDNDDDDDDDMDSSSSTKTNANKGTNYVSDGEKKKTNESDKKNFSTTFNGLNERLPFTVGEFVVYKEDVEKEWPTIWRVHARTLLQKFELFEENGEKLYKSIPTFCGFTPAIVNTLQVVPCRVRQQNRGEFIVEFLTREFHLTPEEQEVVDASMKETEKYQDNFEVYIQTLLSQALDSNFLAEIIQEKDEYFLINMQAIDDVTEQHRRRLVIAAGWENRIIERSLATWPCYNILYNLYDSDQNKKCESCEISDATSRVLVYGQAYNNESLEGRTPGDDIAKHKEMLICRRCIRTVALYNKLVHQKYLMFVECAKRVTEKRSAGPEKDTTVILNELLADEVWLSQLFKKARSTWSEVDRFELNKKSEEMGCST